MGVFYSGYVSCTVSGRRDWRAQYAVTNKNQGAKIREQESTQSVYKGPEAQKQFTHSLGESKQFRADSMVDSTTVTQGADLELNSPIVQDRAVRRLTGEERCCEERCHVENCSGHAVQEAFHDGRTPSRWPGKCYPLCCCMQEQQVEGHI